LLTQSRNAMMIMIILLLIMGINTGSIIKELLQGKKNEALQCLLIQLPLK